MKKIRRLRRVRRFEATRVEFKPSYRRRTARTYVLLKCAVDRLQVVHASDCAVHNEPAYPNGPCNCGARS